MEKIALPAKESWRELCRRPEIPGIDLENVVRDIINSFLQKRVGENYADVLRYPESISKMS